MIAPAKADIDSLIQDLSSNNPRVKYGSAKSLALLSEAEPGSLYPRFDFFLALLESEFTVLRWNATRILANLAPADVDRKLEAALEKYLSPIPGPEMIGAANAIQYASRIALAKPHLADRITAAILGVRRARYKTAECRNIAIGHAIASLNRFFSLITDKAAVIRFVSAQLDNPRPATGKKAAAFLKKHSAPRNRPS